MRIKVAGLLLQLFALNLAISERAGFAFQTTQTRGRQDDQPVRLKTTLVQAPVVVSESGGRYIVDLRKEEFELFEDGVKQKIEFFGSIDQPFHVALLLDCSGSTAEQLDQIKAAALAFIENLRPQDQAMIVVFSDSVEVLSEMTGDRETLRRSVSSVSSGEYTQVYEAVYTAVWERLDQIRGRKAVILFTDGVDTASSEITDEDTLDAVVASEDVIVYPIRYATRAAAEQKLETRERKRAAPVGEPEKTWKRIEDGRRALDHAYRRADEYLHKLANLSGGIIERADELTDLKGALGRIAEELRRQYLLGYYPAEESPRERTITVRVSRPGAVVRARPGYRSSQ